MKRIEHGLEALIFASRWAQAPMFVGLILASLLYAYRFMLELIALLPTIHTRNEDLLLGVLGLVDMMMVANLVAMIVIGGYTLFVSKLNIVASEDRPEWLDQTTAATLKIELAAALVGVFLLSSLILSISERILHPPHAHTTNSIPVSHSASTHHA